MTKEALPNIGLNIIVKNEEKVIKRMLDTVAPFIDWYTVIDTGSTDKTKEIVKEVMDAHGIPGEIHDHVWKDFRTARNFALEKGKDKSVWGFWIDADEQLILNEKFNKDILVSKLANLDVCSTAVEYGPSKYFRSQLFRFSIDWEWKGAVHEVMYPPKGTKPRSGMVEGLYTLVTPDGASWGDGSRETQRKKYLEHAEMLEEYIKEDKDVRWLFYLAQSYRDAFEYAKSEEIYAKRVAAGGGYPEELYFSQLMVAAAQANQKKPIPEILDSYLKCGKYDPNRCEHLLPVARHHQGTQNYHVSYMISKYCFDNFKKNPFPKSTLFIDAACYDWQIYDLHSVNCYYTGRYGEARTAYNKLRKAISKDLVPVEQAKRIKSQEKWYTKKHEDELTKQRKLQIAAAKKAQLV
jgi:glycosyltransferase involved in cell wall biosynthesis